MAYSNYNLPTMTQPQYNPELKAIIPGKFLDIDEKYYNDKPKDFYVGEAFGRMGKPILPHGQNVIYHPTGFIEKSPVLPLGPLRANYNTYLYNQITGWDANHPMNAKPMGTKSIIFK
jgi:hypothetical protein